MSVRPARQNFTVVKGTTFRVELTLHVGDRSTPVRDLVGATAAMPIEDRQTGLLLTTLTTSNGGITLGGATGTIELFMSDEATQAAIWELGSYVLYLTQGGDTDSLIHGNFSIRNL